MMITSTWPQSHKSADSRDQCFGSNPPLMRILPGTTFYEAIAASPVTPGNHLLKLAFKSDGGPAGSGEGRGDSVLLELASLCRTALESNTPKMLPTT
jgi:hypothetical protein